MDSEMIPDDPPIRQRLKAVHLLDVNSGHADVAETGEPIVILSLGHRNEVEQPIMLNLKDAKRLARGILRALSDHGDPVAEDVAERLLTCEWQATVPHEHMNEPSIIPQKKRTVPLRNLLEGLPLLGVKLSVRHNPGHEPEAAGIYGGYSKGRKQYLLMRFIEKRPHDSVVHHLVAKIGTKSTIIIAPSAHDEKLPAQDWQRFIELPEGAAFRLGRIQWTKTGEKKLRQLLSGRVFDAR